MGFFDRAWSGCGHSMSFERFNMQNKQNGSIRSHDCSLKRWVKNRLTQYSFYVMESRVSSNCPRNIQRPSLSENRKELSCFLRWNFLRFAGPLNIFEPFLVPVDKNNSYDQFWDRGRKHKIANSEETALVTPIFLVFKWSARQFSQIEEDQRQSQIIAGERLPSQNLSLRTEIILIIFTTTNDSPNLAHCLLMDFSDLEKRNIKIF